MASPIGASAVVAYDAKRMNSTLFSTWQLWAVLSAIFAALTAIFAKVGVANISSDLATLIRTCVILLTLALIVYATGQFQSFARDLIEAKTLADQTTEIQGRLITQLGAIAMWRNFRQDPAAALAGYQRALALGYTRPITEIYEAAGIRFDFSTGYLRTLADFVREEMAAL